MARGIMKKTKTLLMLLSVAIVIIPIAVEAYAYRDNLLGLAIPPELMSVMNGGSPNGSNSGSAAGNVNSITQAISSFKMPQMVEEPTYDPQTQTASVTFNVTNPLSTPISITVLQAGVVSHDDGTLLGNISIPQALTINPGQTVDVTALAKLSDQAIKLIQNQHPGQNSINVDVTDLTLDVAGVTMHIDRQNLGNIEIPQGLIR
jgi:hypothetical protein